MYEISKYIDESEYDYDNYDAEFIKSLDLDSDDSEDDIYSII